MEWLMEAGKGLLEIADRALATPAFVDLIVAVVVAVWALPRIQNLRRRAKESIAADAWDLAERAVAATYATYTRERKAMSMDGTLTHKEERTARQEARHTFLRLARSEAPKVLRHYGEQGLFGLLEAAYRTFKRRNRL